MEFFDYLLDSSPWVPRGSCGDWDGWDTWYVLGSLLVVLAYTMIPVGLIWVWHGKRKSIQWPGLLLSFAVFIAACGATHLLDAVSFVWPAYRLATVFVWITAIASLKVAIRLPFAVREIMTWRTPDEYRVLLAERDVALAAERDLRLVVEQRFAAARTELHEARDSLHAATWKAERLALVNEISGHIAAAREFMVQPLEVSPDATAAR